MRKFILFCMLILLFVTSIQAQNSGITGKLSWSFNSNNLTLTISGNGEMPNYDWDTAPWFSIRSEFNKVVISEGVTSIGMWAFSGASLASVSIPESMTSIGEYAFWDCFRLASISIPKSVMNIRPGAFGFCRSLPAITVTGDNPVYLASEGVLFNKDKTQIVAFPAGKNTTQYTIPNSVTSIGEAAFDGCKKLTSIIIPNSVINIKNGAFHSCSNVTSLNIPNSVTNIGEYAFQRCGSLNFMAIPNSVTSIGEGAFSECNNLNTVVLSNSITRIEYNTFSSCTGLIFVTIPNSVEIIGSNAFYGCSNLTSIAIPHSVKEIGWRAFGRCIGLSTVVASWNTPLAVLDDIFNEVILNNVTLKVPAGRKAYYQRADVWKEFGSIIEPYITIEESKPIDNSNQGCFDIKIKYSTDSVQSASLIIQLPEGFTLDEANTNLTIDFVGLFDLVITKRENNYWLIELNPKTLRGGDIRSDEIGKMLQVAYKVDETLPKGTYDISIHSIQFETPGGDLIPEPMITLPVNVNRWGVANEKIDNSEISVYLINNTLYIETQQPDAIAIYMVNGVKIYDATIPAGTTTIDTVAFPQGVLIVKGKSGWNQKVISK